MTTHGPIQIGNQTASSAADFLQPFHFALAHRFDAFEWFPDKKPSGAGWDENNLTPALRAEVRQLAQAAGMRLSVHARWTANPLRPEAWPVLQTDLELAVALGAPILNIHLYTEEGIPAYARAILPLLHRSAAAGVRVSIENTPETTPRHFNELFEILAQLDPDAAAQAGMCFDLGHANLCAATRNDYLGYFDQLGAHVPLFHLHVHENRGDADSHLPLFTGPAAENPAGVEGFVRRLGARGYTGSLILEQWPAPPEMLVTARDRLRRIFSVCSSRRLLDSSHHGPSSKRTAEPR